MSTSAKRPRTSRRPWPLFLHRRYYQDRPELAELTVEAARACDDAVAGVGCRARGELAEPRRHLARALEVNERSGAPRNTGNVEDGLGAVCLAAGDPAGTVEHFERALEVWRGTAGAERKVAISMLDLGRAFVAVDHPAKALPLLGKPGRN
ncbi:tetratricopeptide repeat protein [Allokutzneria albata]|nr:tetratricopeptide repeat protein [Allokutzneria albata]